MVLREAFIQKSPFPPLEVWPGSRAKECVPSACSIFFLLLGGTHAGVGRVGLGPPVGVFPLFKLEFSITMSTLPKWVI